jgi:multiple sugar transport system ATP-binding protein
VDTDQSIESAELRELAEDAGGGEVPSAGEEGRIVARLDPAAEVTEGQDAELWVDATRLILFDPEDGRNLTTEQQGPAATGGQDTSGREPEAATTETRGGDSDGEAAPGATGGTR